MHNLGVAGVSVQCLARQQVRINGKKPFYRVDRRTEVWAANAEVEIRVAQKKEPSHA